MATAARTASERMRQRALSRPLGDRVGAAIRALRPGQSLCLDTPLTVDEFYDLLDGEGRFELVNGVVYRSVDVTIAREDFFGWLLVVMRVYVETKRLGRVFGSRTGVRINRTSARMPDLAYISSGHLDRLDRLEIAGAADLAVEIVDSAKSRREAVEKQAQYEQLGVPELWVIDLQRRRFAQFVLKDGAYEEVPPSGDGEVQATVIPGLHLQIAWFFQGPNFPHSLEVVQSLLAQ